MPLNTFFAKFFKKMLVPLSREGRNATLVAWIPELLARLQDQPAVFCIYRHRGAFWGESIGRILRCSDSISFSCPFFAYWVWAYKRTAWHSLLYLRESMGSIPFSLSGSNPSFGKCILVRQSKLRLHSLSFLSGFLNLLTIPSDHFEN